ncbi:MAG: 30S ribosomal protein S9 [Anaerolineales bacterium]
MAEEYYEAVGRRKRATARVRIVSGKGAFVVNDKPAEEYFPRLGDLDRIKNPLRVAGFEDKLDISVLVNGGGITGQSSAVGHGVARALLKMDENLRPQLRGAGVLTRDARIKERKKPGLKRARKAPTYTKR